MTFLSKLGTVTAWIVVFLGGVACATVFWLNLVGYQLK